MQLHLDDVQEPRLEVTLSGALYRINPFDIVQATEETDGTTVEACTATRTVLVANGVPAEEANMLPPYKCHALVVSANQFLAELTTRKNG